MVLLTVDDHKERLCPIVDCLIDGSSGTYKPLNSRGSLIIGYAWDGFELWTLMVWVQIGFIGY